MRRDERGEVSTETVIVAPVLFSLVLLTVHAGSWWMSSQFASVVAARAARAAAVRGTADPVRAGLDAAERTAAELGVRLALAPVVRVSGDEVNVSVTLSAPRTVPGFSSRVTRTAAVPVESFRSEDDR